MVKGLYTAYTGMVNEQRRLDVISNNLANADTTGFKKEGATSEAFDSVLAVKIKDSTENAPTRKLGKMSMGVKVGETYTDYSQGSLRQTENPFDLALSEKGFFSVEFTNKADETSVKYTRDGSFTLTKDGELVTKDGDFVLDANGKHIKLNPLAMTSVEKDGTIVQDGIKAAKIGITDFADYNYLEHYGENYYQPVDGASAVKSDAQVLEGYLETSNIKVVSEMVEMISVTRAYETNQKLIQTIDGSLEIATNQLGKL